MDNNKNISVICQCLNTLQIENFRSTFFDHRSQKLYTGSTIQLHILAQLLNLKTYDQITEQLHAHPELKDIVDLESISGSQLSRKTINLCTSSLQALFYGLVGEIQELTKPCSGISSTIGRLSVIDASSISLPSFLGGWAKCSSKKCGVMLHTRYLVVDPSIAFPDKVILTTAHVRESKVVMELIVADDVTYVMDRGYEKYLHYKKWLQDGIRFVVRTRERAKLTPVEGSERSIPLESGHIIRDVDVTTNVSDIPMRLIEFMDEKKRFFRIVTSRWDVSAAEVAEIYKNRWMVELFFKWIKQHLNVVKLYSKQPDAVWNQLFLSLIAFAVNLLIKLKLQTKKSQWTVLKFVQTYFFHSWNDFVGALERPPTKESKGRQKKENNEYAHQESKRIIIN